MLTAPDAGPQRAAALLARSALEDDVCQRGFLAHAALKAGLPDSLKARAYNQLAWSEGFLQLALDTGSDYARRALEAAEQAGDLEQQAVALGRLAHLLAIRGQPDPGYLERAVTSGQVVTVDDRPQLMLGLHLMWRGDLEAAKTILEGQYAEAVRLADDSARPYLLVHLADLAVRRGSGNDLSRHVSERRRLAAYQHEYGGVLSNYVEALAAAYAGPAHQARESAEAGLTQATEQGVVPAQLRLRWVLGLANLLDADPRGAWAVLEPALTTMVEKGVGEPGFVPAVPDAVTALAALGDLPRAKQVAAMLDRSAAAGHRWAAPAQAYCKGLVLLAAGAPDAGATELIEARDSFESIGFKFDAARSTLEAGGALRRSGQRGAAHAMVSDAVRRFAAMGASAWAERAESELARAGGRRTGQTLTAGEEQVAALAAAGRTNREIAAQLFVSVATVEANLTRAYRKLGVSSRSQLTRLRTMAAE